MYKQLVLHAQTRQSLDRIIQSKPQAIMFTGNEGSGKQHTALCLAEELLEQDITKHPYFFHIKPDGKSFSIEQIRELQKKMRLKTTGSAQIRRIALLQDVHTMTTEAQNALLKLLEEPPADTVLILTAQGDKSLKPTIYSRVQRVHIKPVVLHDLPNDLKEHRDIHRLYGLSGGDIGLLYALLQQNTEHPLVNAINEAKSIITKTPFERLVVVDELGKDKERLTNIISALKRISLAALRLATSKEDARKKEQWTRILDQVYITEKLLPTIGNNKLLLSELFLTI